MSFSEELKQVRKRAFLSQQGFAKAVNVSFSTVNRWETGKTMPNLSAMKNIKAFCETNQMDFSALEQEWLKAGCEENL